MAESTAKDNRSACHYILGVNYLHKEVKTHNSAADLEEHKSSRSVHRDTMKLILMFVLVFSLGILTVMAAKIPQHDESGEPALSDDPSGTNREKRSPGLFNCIY